MATSKPTIATVCSHTSLQIFHGARQEGLRSIGICLKEPPKFYDAFPLAKPDEFFIIDSYKDLLDAQVAKKLKDKDAIIIPHGSFVEYMGAENFKKLEIPVYGNKAVLDWESDRVKERKWLERAGLKMPREIKDPKDIKGPVIVKYHGAKGGRGFFIAKDYNEFKENVKLQDYTIQEYISGTRFYFHFFYSPIKNSGYRLKKGSLELLSMDRRVESDIDEIFKLGSLSELRAAGVTPSFTVTGNIPLVLRESLLPKVFDMGARTVEESFKLFGGLWGPFCLEAIVDKDMNIHVFEISARIVAGTNVAVPDSPYSVFIQPDLTTGRRIAQEIKAAAKAKRMDEILT
jgi:5-formaminoimidazole-4-carboxamide-1-(beta)-D-ribofuranosyl 5'-monophosphate synthetase